jgi:gas vesicle protein
MFDEDDSASTALIAFLLGGLAGASLACLFAPGAGEETRRRIGETVRQGALRGRALARRGRAVLDAAGQAQARVHPAPGNGQDNVASERVPEPGLPSTGGPGFESPRLG